MPGTKWLKPSPATLDYFERLAPGPPLEPRTMFGMPCRFLNGHLLVGVFENSLTLHLSEADRAACIRAGAEPFMPMGREMREYVAIEPGHFGDRELKLWIVRGMRYLASLPPKARGAQRATSSRKSSEAKAKPQKPSAPPGRRRVKPVSRPTKPPRASGTKPRGAGATAPAKTALPAKKKATTRRPTRQEGATKRAATGRASSAKKRR